MTNKELELIAQLTEVAMVVSELRAENKILKEINEKIIKGLHKHEVSKAACDNCGGSENGCESETSRMGIMKVGEFG